MKKSDLSELKMTDIDTKLEENQAKLQKLRFQKALQQIEDPLEIRLPLLTHPLSFILNTSEREPFLN